jgi:uncharacterized repeat protein (TIGR03803 family)
VRDAWGNLFGTTNLGGEYSAGTVFELSPGANGTWSEKVLWNFAGSPTDGSFPEAGLVLDWAGNLYGTTSLGLNNPTDYDGYGLAFELTPQAGGTWTEKILQNLGTRTSGGSNPQGNMILDARGNLFGTTAEDGYCDNCGDVFEISPHADGTWTEKNLHQFDPSTADGFWPQGGVAFGRRGNLYGTTAMGTSGVDQLEYEWGTVFELTPEADGFWTERVVYAFKGETVDGYFPQAGLILDAAGNLYGTTMFGGGIDYEDGRGFGFGTVFKIEDPDRFTRPAPSPWHPII